MYRETTSAEIPIADALGKRDFDRATTLTLEAYGAEIMRLLLGLHRDEDLASDAFSDFAVRLWKSMPRYESRCSMRTWAYLIARRASSNVTRGDKRRGRVLQSLEDHISKLVVQIRTTTLTQIRQEKIEALTALRAELEPEDQLLLVLRIDREMEWADLALVFAGEESTTKEVLDRESARLRKRFQHVKERLLALGKKRGLFKGSEPDQK